MSATPHAERRVWMITGTSSGFGKRLVPMVLSRGDYVVATARDPAKVDFQLSETDRARLHVVQMDLTDAPEKIQSIVSGALAVWGRIDVLINNAGWAPKSLLEEASPTHTQSVFQTNVFGVLNTTNAVLPQMRSRRTGTVVFLGSRSVWKADTILTGHYLASKAAIHAFAETYAAEVTPFNVRVILAVPGGFRTENIHTAPLTSENHIPDYNALREEAYGELTERWVAAPGCPTKIMSLLVDVVTGEGKAADRNSPLYLVLGRPTYAAAKAFHERLGKEMDAWRDVAENLDFDDAQGNKSHIISTELVGFLTSTSLRVFVPRT
ncbi:NAD-P-binding protein [Fomitopsis serialis]|uniref:NAD-P-binding protein n=1 Tax=Fomitopsis serialis TaxID=139415 RepID=UPI002008D961|nr:NAD-P-binding protein [Neoantrodia serialis]KAH9921654.1 NAD-P-binding protein [Neoantrodia serialis]